MQKLQNLSIFLFICLSTFANITQIKCAPQKSSSPPATTQAEVSINSTQSSKRDKINIASERKTQTPFQFQQGKLPEMKEILDISKDFFTALVFKNIDEATTPLFKIFQISDGSKNKLKKDIVHLKNTIGPMFEAEYIGYRTVGNLRRFFTLYFISYHGIMPLAWELTFYQPIAKSKWQLNFIRFNSDHIYEFLKYPMLRLNQIQKNIKR